MKSCQVFFLRNQNFKTEKPCPHCVFEKFNADKIGNFKYNINTMSDRKLKVYLDTSVVSYLQQEDSQHIAVAVLNERDVIVSWNFKHLINIKTIKGIRNIKKT